MVAAFSTNVVVFGLPAVDIRAISFCVKDTRILAHVDDLVFSGPERVVDSVLASLQKFIQLIKGDSLTQTGDTCKMLGRTTARLDTGYSLCGDDTLALCLSKNLV